MEIEIPKAAITEINKDFIQGMVNRMAMSYFKYGAIREAYPNKVNAISSLKLRLSKYEQTGNTEYLMDIANFAMIEFILPAHPNAYFKAEDSNKSPGRIWQGERTATNNRNDSETD